MTNALPAESLFGADAIQEFVDKSWLEKLKRDLEVYEIIVEGNGWSMPHEKGEGEL